MAVVECSHDGHGVGQRRSEDHDVHDLMAGSEEIEATRVPALWELYGVKFMGQQVIKRGVNLVKSFHMLLPSVL